MKILLFIVTILYSTLVTAQDYAYIEQDSMSVVYYRLSDHQKLYNTKQYFPYEGGQRGANFGKLMSNGIYTLQVTDSIVISPQTVIHIPVYFTKNVKKFTIHITDIKGNRYQVARVLDADGYQVSIYSNPEKISIGKVDEGIKSAFCTAEAIDNQKPIELVFSNLMIVDYVKKRVISPLPFFKNIFDVNAKQATTLIKPIFKFSKSKFDWLSFEYCQSPIYISTLNDSTSARQRLHKIARACLVDYPFYAEKRLEPAQVLAEFDTIWKNNFTRSEIQLAKIYQNFLKKTFHDGHFKVEFNTAKTKSSQVVGPIRLSKIKDTYIVSAVLDTLLEKSILVGSKITHINGRKIEKIADSLIKINYSREYALKRDQLVNLDICRELTTFEEGTNVIFDYLDSAGKLEKVNVIYRKRYPIKANFLNTHCEFRTLNSDVIYFKFNAFDELPALRLQTILESNKHKNLVLDVRSNGGGDIIYLDDLLSLLIQPSDFQIFRGINRSGSLKDSVYISRNNPVKIDSSSRIVVLIDSRTSCTSELFLYLLKKYNKNVIIVGSDNTSGTLANAFSFVFPGKDFTLTVNAPEIFKHDLGFPIEDIGIQPDIKVELESVYDLKPYQDKVLRVGLANALKTDVQTSSFFKKLNSKDK